MSLKTEGETSPGQIDLDLDPIDGIVLVRVESGQTDSVRERLKLLPGIRETVTVGGEFDFICKTRTSTLDGLGNLVTDGIQRIDGIRKTTTLVTLGVIDSSS